MHSSTYIQYIYFCIFNSLRNVCSTADIGCIFKRDEFEAIALAARDDDNITNANYNPGFPNGMHIWVREPQATVTIFTSGKANVVGAKTEAEAEAVTQEIALLLERLGKTVRASLSLSLCISYFWSYSVLFSLVVCILMDLLQSSQVSGFTLTQLVANVELGFEIDIEKLTQTHPKCT